MTLIPSWESYLSRCREFITSGGLEERREKEFNQLAVDLFRLQFESNFYYQRFCRGRGKDPEKVQEWQEVPLLPVEAYKQGDVTLLPGEDRPFCFQSSGTTLRSRSRHYHNAQSLALYEESLRRWFQPNLLSESDERRRIIALTPSPQAAPHSSLVHMFKTVVEAYGSEDSGFFGSADTDGNWHLSSERLLPLLHKISESGEPVLLLGTAFSFVHLVDAMTATGGAILLPSETRLMETGGYKGRSREMPKEHLIELLSRFLGIVPQQVISEYGMSELSSQAYNRQPSGSASEFRFPPWARVKVVSPENNKEVEVGQTGILCIWDLANFSSCLAIQTEDLGIRTAGGFEWIGRLPATDPKGCSLQFSPD